MPPPLTPEDDPTAWVRDRLTSVPPYPDITRDVQADILRRPQAALQEFHQLTGSALGGLHGFHTSGRRLQMSVLDQVDLTGLTVEELARLVDVITWTHTGHKTFEDAQCAEFLALPARPLPLNVTAYGNFAYLALHSKYCDRAALRMKLEALTLHTRKPAAVVGCDII